MKRTSLKELRQTDGLAERWMAIFNRLLEAIRQEDEAGTTGRGYENAVDQSVSDMTTLGNELLKRPLSATNKFKIRAGVRHLLTIKEPPDTLDD